MKHAALVSALLLLSVELAFSASTPPDAINYQGVLRNSSDEPLDGTYGMVFRFFSAASGGEEILVDAHGSVTVSGGLFNVELGSGTVTDGSGPGEYTTLSRVFAGYSDLYVEVEVGGETLLPRVRVVAAGYALNTRYVRGVEIVSEGPLDLYVDGINGDDTNNGLSSTTAKRTIQAAVNSVPVVSNGPATIHIADGTYHESVLIGPRSQGSFGLLTIVGNELSPQSVVLDGQGSPERGIFVAQGLAAIRGLEVTGFSQAGIEVGLGFLSLEDCRIIGNGSADEPGFMVTRGGADIRNCLITNNANDGIEVSMSEVDLRDVQIIGNGRYGLRIHESGKFDLEGSLLIENNAGTGVVANDHGTVDLGGRMDLVIQSNAGGSMQASYHSTIRGYGNGTTGSCVEADAHSMCVP